MKIAISLFISVLIWNYTGIAPIIQIALNAPSHFNQIIHDSRILEVK